MAIPERGDTPDPDTVRVFLETVGWWRSRPDEGSFHEPETVSDVLWQAMVTARMDPHERMRDLRDRQLALSRYARRPDLADGDIAEQYVMLHPLAALLERESTITKTGEMS